MQWSLPCKALLSHEGAHPTQATEYTKIENNKKIAVWVFLFDLEEWKNCYLVATLSSTLESAALEKHGNFWILMPQLATHYDTHYIHIQSRMITKKTKKLHSRWEVSQNMCLALPRWVRIKTKKTTMPHGIAKFDFCYASRTRTSVVKILWFSFLRIVLDFGLPKCV